MLRLLSVSLLLFLAACNGSEDFSDADLGGPIIQPVPSGTNFVGDGSEIEVVLAAGGSVGGEDTPGVVNNLGYACGGFEGYIPGPDVEDRPNVALCPRDATSIRYFLGPLHSEAQVTLGKAWLPAESNQGRYQLTPADLFTSPSKLLPSSDRRVLHFAALLQALDSDNNPGSTDVIDVPLQAHIMVTNCCGDIPPTPSPLFDYPDYTTFTQVWNNGSGGNSGWMDYLRTQENKSYPFPAESEAMAQLDSTLARIRAGTFNAESIGLTDWGFVLNELDRTQEIEFQMTTLIYPDGAARGVGLGIRKNSARGSVISLDGSARVDARQELFDWSARGVTSGQDVDPVSISLKGRVLGTFAYYIEEGERIKSDYRSDYPDSNYDAESHPEDAARYQAEGYGTDVNDGLWWLTRTGQVAVNWDLAVLQQLRINQDDRFYDMEFRRACTDSNEDLGWSSCPSYDSSGASAGSGDYPIPQQEFEYGNYVPELDVDGSESGDGGIEITHERRKEWANNFAVTQSLRVQILDNGDVVADEDRDCSPVQWNASAGYYEDDDQREYRVGYVTRTRHTPAGDPESFNLALLLTGSSNSTDAHDTIPHYAVQVSGRVDVRSERHGEIFRLSDNSFNDDVRALWTDFYLPLRKQNDLYPNPTPRQRHEISVSASGSTEGRLVETTVPDSDPAFCEPI